MKKAYVKAEDVLDMLHRSRDVIDDRTRRVLLDRMIQLPFLEIDEEEKWQ